MSGLPGTFHWRRYPGYPASRRALRTISSGLVSLRLLAFMLLTVFSFNGGQFLFMRFHLDLVFRGNLCPRGS